MTHSPAPWTIKTFEKTYDAESPIGVRIVAANGEVIADNETYYPADLNPDNAPIIAAGPDLLAAAKALRDYYNAETYKDHKTHPWHDLLQAIAKAEESIHL